MIIRELNWIDFDLRKYLLIEPFLSRLDEAGAALEDDSKLKRFSGSGVLWVGIWT